MLLHSAAPSEEWTSCISPHGWFPFFSIKTFIWIFLNSPHTPRPPKSKEYQQKPLQSEKLGFFLCCIMQLQIARSPKALLLPFLGLCGQLAPSAQQPSVALKNPLTLWHCFYLGVIQSLLALSHSSSSFHLTEEGQLCQKSFWEVNAQVFLSNRVRHWAETKCQIPALLNTDGILETASWKSQCLLEYLAAQYEANDVDHLNRSNENCYLLPTPPILYFYIRFRKH